MSVFSNITGFPLLLKAVAISLVVGLLGGGYTAYHYTNKFEQADFNKKITKQQLDASTKLNEALEKNRRTEEINKQITQQLELTYNETQQTISNLRNSNQQLSAKLGGLHDPYARKNSCGTLPSITNSTIRAADDPATGQLSSEASQFLLDFAQQCDEAANYAKVAHGWATSDSFTKPR